MTGRKTSPPANPGLIRAVRPVMKGGMTMPKASTAALAHIPGRKGVLPYIGVAPEFIREPYAMILNYRRRFGPVFKYYLLGDWIVSLGGADAVEYVLTDPDKLFSSKDGWRLLTDLFPGGLMLRDFDDHRAHRRVMQSAFRASAIESHLEGMNDGIAALIAGWGDRRDFHFYPEIKKLTLALGGAAFMGLPPDDPRADRMNRAFRDEIAASLALIRLGIPGTRYGRGLAGRRHLTETFRSLIAERRADPGPDFFSQLCAARDEDGTGWTEQEIVDHLNFLMMAAHDTTTSALTTMVWALATRPEWQEAVRAEVLALGEARVSVAAAATLDVTERVFKEALRFMPPVPFIPRRSMRAFRWEGVEIPAGVHVTVSPGLTMMSEALWTDPERFDPDRFVPDRAEDRGHRFAWAPFGGGAHKCIGLHFAMLQAKAFTVQFLRAYRVEAVADTDGPWARVPIPRPRNGLPLRLVPLSRRSAPSQHRPQAAQSETTSVA